MGRSLRLANELRRLVSRLERTEGRFLDQHGLTPPQWAVLLGLASLGEAPISAIGEISDITKGTLTGVIARLEKAGLLSVRASRRDGRSRVAALTADGKTLVEELREPHARLFHRQFRGIARSELREFLRLLRRRQLRHTG